MVEALLEKQEQITPNFEGFKRILIELDPEEAEAGMEVQVELNDNKSFRGEIHHIDPDSSLPFCIVAPDQDQPAVVNLNRLQLVNLGSQPVSQVLYELV